MNESTLEEKLTPGELLGGRYTIIRELGSGGMASVYEARDERLKVNLALKVLSKKHQADKDFVKRFYREAESTARLNHPNIARVYNVAELDRRHCISMELVKGKTLEKRVKEHSAQLHFFPADELCGIALETLDALRYAHKEGIIHRDIKPSNIMLQEDGTVKITDFGIAKIIPIKEEDKDKKQTALTKRFEPIGTPSYMSPEQIRQDDLTGKTDVFSLGVVLYEMLTGRLPFENSKASTTTSQLINTITNKLKEPSRINSQIPRPLEDMILRMLEKEPAKRYGAESAYQDLNSYARGQKVKVEGRFRRKFEMNRRKFITIGILGMIGLSTATGISYKIISDHNTREKAAILYNKEYVESIYSTIDRIQDPSVDSWKNMAPLLMELSDKIHERVNWLYSNLWRNELEKKKDEANPYIYPLASRTIGGNEGEIAYLGGDSSLAGFTTDIFYGSFLKYESMAANEKDIDKKRAFTKLSKEFLDNFFFYSKKMAFDKMQETNQRDEIRLAMGRFDSPARWVLTDLKKRHPETFAAKRNEIEEIISKYSEAIKIVIEKRYNPAKGFINRIGENTPNNPEKPTVCQDSEIARLLCDGFRLLNLKKQVFNKFGEHGRRVKTEKDYLETMIQDADTKIRSFVTNPDPAQSAQSTRTKDYLDLMLGILCRKELLEEIADPSSRNINLNNLTHIDMKSRKEAGKKADEYSKVLDQMQAHLFKNIPENGICRYYLTKNASASGRAGIKNPFDNMATLRLMEFINRYAPPNQSGTARVGFEDIELRRFLLVKGINSREFISGWNKNTFDLANPAGFVKETRYDLNNGAYLGGTFIETDAYYIRNMDLLAEEMKDLVDKDNRNIKKIEKYY